MANIVPDLEPEIGIDEYIINTEKINNEFLFKLISKSLFIEIFKNHTKI